MTKTTKSNKMKMSFQQFMNWHNVESMPNTLPTPVTAGWTPPVKKNVVIPLRTIMKEEELLIKR